MPDCFVNRLVLVPTGGRKPLSVVLLTMLLISANGFDIAAQPIPSSLYLLNGLQSHDAVFLGEAHNVANPIRFLTKNIELLYNEANLRYVFLEDQTIDKHSFEDFVRGAGIFFPWESNTHNYDWIGFYSKIDEINLRVDPAERIRLIATEAGYEYVPGASLNGRDEFLAARIAQVLSSSRGDDRALIFYGNGHGYKTPNERIDPNRVTLVQNLIERGIDVFAINSSLYSFLYDLGNGNVYGPRSSEYEGIYRELGPYGMDQIEGGESVEYEQSVAAYDGMIYYGEIEYGIPIYYVKNHATIEELSKVVNFVSDNIAQLDPDFAHELLSRAFYFLRYHLGEDFPFPYWNSTDDLFIVAEYLSNTYLDQPFSMEEDTPGDIATKRGYLNYLALAFEGLNWNHQTTIDYALEAQQIYRDVFIDYVMVRSFFRMSEIESTYGERALEIIENMMNRDDILFFPYLDIVVDMRNGLLRNPSDETQYQPDDREVFRIFDGG
jgi:hypothetical protein